MKSIIWKGSMNRFPEYIYCTEHQIRKPSITIHSPLKWSKQRFSINYSGFSAVDTLFAATIHLLCFCIKCRIPVLIELQHCRVPTTCLHKTYITWETYLIVFFQFFFPKENCFLSQKESVSFYSTKYSGISKNIG